MPELPEVETTRRGLEPYLSGKTIESVVVRDSRLRWPVPRGLARTLRGQRIQSVERRGKYLVLRLEKGYVLIHLGMSGHLRLVPAKTPPSKHDHVDLGIGPGKRILRLTDPRRFGSIHYGKGDPLFHPRLAALGPEPLGAAFNSRYLLQAVQGRRVAIKVLLMDSAVVVGIGNIYANEALFGAGIRPDRPASSLNEAECRRLIAAAKRVLRKAIAAGGTTLRDFLSASGQKGYFQQKLKVYGRGGEPCVLCHGLLQEVLQGQRSTVFCPRCQH